MADELTDAKNATARAWFNAARSAEAALNDCRAERDSLRNQLDMAQAEARGYAEDVAKAQIRAHAAEARVEALSEALGEIAASVPDSQWSHRQIQYQKVARAALAEVKQ